MVKIILVTHGNLAREMLNTTAQIIGKTPDDFATLSIAAASSVEAEAAKLKALLSDCPDGAVILTDIFGGSATNVALTASKDNPKCNVITGLNLSMLLTAVNNRKNYPPKNWQKKLKQTANAPLLTPRNC